MKASLIDNHCRVCNNKNNKLIVKDLAHIGKMIESLNIDDKLKSSSYECTQCGHQYMSPIIDESTIDDYYKNLSSDYFDKPIKDYRAKENQDIFKRVRREKKSGKVLEIGCGNGFLLNIFKENGFDCTGIEPSPKAAKYAKEMFNLYIVNDYLSADNIPNDNYDIILLMDVIEHVYHPDDLIRLIYDKLSKGGILVLLTGNSDSITAKFWRRKWYFYFTWEHISFFNEKSIRYLLKQNNLNVIEYKTLSHSGCFVYNLYVSFIHNPLKYIYNFWIKQRFKHMNYSFDHMFVISQKQ